MTILAATLESLYDLVRTGQVTRAERQVTENIRVTVYRMNNHTIRIDIVEEA